MGYRFLSSNNTTQSYTMTELLGIGDADGDGLGDILIAFNRANSFSGEVYLVCSSDLAALDAADGATDQSINLGNIGATHGGYRFAGEAGSYAGSALADLGDIDGDGLTDFAIGAGQAASGGGAAYIITSSDLSELDAHTGSADGVISLANVGQMGAEANRLGFRLQGERTFDENSAERAGDALASVVDMNGDGTRELLVGAWKDAKAFLVPLGSLDALDAADGAANGTIRLIATSGAGFYRFDSAGQAGVDVTAVGTTAGTSRLVIGASNEGTNGWSAGGAHVIATDELAALDAADGTTNGRITIKTPEWRASANGTSTFFLRGSDDYERAGWYVGAAGDFNGDGVEDFMVYATGQHGNISGPTTGNVLMVSGAHLTALDAHDGASDGYIELANLDEVTTAGGRAGYRFIGALSDDNAGENAMTTIGDFDGDGLDDIVIGANKADTPVVDGGAVYLIPAVDLAALDAADGASDGTINLGNVGAAGGYRFTASSSGATGLAISATGDIDGDGRKELLVSSTLYTTSGYGSAYLVYSNDIAAMDAADGTVDGRINLANFAVCYVRGTLILTPGGEVPIEAIGEGDLVLTLDAGPRPVRWAGMSVRPGEGRTAPVAIPAGVLGNRRALCVSPQHRLLMPGGEDGRGVFAPALKLAGRDGIARLACASVAYHHLLLDRHHVILAEGAPSESFFPGPEAWRMLDAGARAEIRARFPAIDPELARAHPLAPGRIGVPGYGPLARPQSTALPQMPTPRSAARVARVALHA